MLGITIDVVSFLSTAFYNLSKYEDKSGRPSFNPFLFLQSLTTAKGLLDSSMGSPCITCQWSNTHWGKAWPPVFDLKSAVKPGKIIKNHEKSWNPKKTFSIEKGASSDIQKPSMVEKPPVETANGLEDQDFIIKNYVLQKLRKWELTERFVDRQVSLDVEHGSSGNLVLFEHVSTTTIEHTINSTDSVFRALKTF